MSRHHQVFAVSLVCAVAHTARSRASKLIWDQINWCNRVEGIRSLAETMADKPNIGVEKMERSNSLNAAGSFLWRGPSFMSRMAGHEAPHEAPRATETKMRKVRQPKGTFKPIRMFAGRSERQPGGQLASSGVLNRSAVLQLHPQVLGLFGLSMMSTAAIIGAGIFVLTGVVAKEAG